MRKRGQTDRQTGWGEQCCPNPEKLGFVVGENKGGERRFPPAYVFESFLGEFSRPPMQGGRLAS